MATKAYKSSFPLFISMHTPSGKRFFFPNGYLVTDDEEIQETIAKAKQLPIDEIDPKQVPEPPQKKKSAASTDGSPMTADDLLKRAQAAVSNSGSLPGATPKVQTPLKKD